MKLDYALLIRAFQMSEEKVSKQFAFHVPCSSYASYRSACTVLTESTTD